MRATLVESKAALVVYAATGGILGAQCTAMLEHAAGLEVTNRELVRERDEARKDLELQNEECQAEIGFKVQARERADYWRKRFESLASDALVALAGHVATPEETYHEAPHCLKGDIGRLVKERDEARALAELRLAQVNEVSKGVADVLKTSWDLAAVCRDLLEEAEVTLSALRDSGSDLSELGALVERAKAVLERLKVLA